MSNETKTDVRSHLQERQWLLNLGQGNISEGVRKLVELSTGKPWGNSAPNQQKNQSQK